MVSQPIPTDNHPSESDDAAASLDLHALTPNADDAAQEDDEPLTAHDVRVFLDDAHCNYMTGEGGGGNARTFNPAVPVYIKTKGKGAHFGMFRRKNKAGYGVDELFVTVSGSVRGDQSKLGPYGTWAGGKDADKEITDQNISQLKFSITLRCPPDASDRHKFNWLILSSLTRRLENLVVQTAADNKTVDYPWVRMPTGGQDGGALYVVVNFPVFQTVQTKDLNVEPEQLAALMKGGTSYGEVMEMLNPTSDDTSEATLENDWIGDPKNRFVDITDKENVKLVALPIYDCRGQPIPTKDLRYELTDGVPVVMRLRMRTYDIWQGKGMPPKRTCSWSIIDAHMLPSDATEIAEVGFKPLPALPIAQPASEPTTPTKRRADSPAGGSTDRSKRSFLLTPTSGHDDYFGGEVGGLATPGAGPSSGGGVSLPNTPSKIGSANKGKAVVLKPATRSSTRTSNAQTADDVDMAPAN